MLRRLVLAAAVAAALLASAQPGRADDDARERSRAAFRRGVIQAHEGNYTAARDSFLEAYKLFPHPSILLNVGIARAHTGEWLEAEQDLVHFLADDGGAQPDELASARAGARPDAQPPRHLPPPRLARRRARQRSTPTPSRSSPGGFVDVRTTRGTHDARTSRPTATRPSHQPVVVASERAPERRPHAGAAGRRARVARGRASTPRGGSSSAAASWRRASASSRASRPSRWRTGTTPSAAARYQDPATKARGIVFRTSADVAFLGALALGGVGAYFLLTPGGPGGGPGQRGPRPGLRGRGRALLTALPAAA